MRKYSSNLAFIDLLFNLILGFVFLFVVSFLLINEPTEKDAISQKAEYMVIMSWDDDKDVDVDLWVESPDGLVGFQNTLQGFMNLDRDDLGHRNDRISTGTDESQIAYINQEVVNIRGFQPGEYVVNVHYYHTSLLDSEIDVKVEVYKLNPYSEVYSGSRKFSYKGEEQTFVRFSMRPDGSYYGVNELPKDIVNKRRQEQVESIRKFMGTGGDGGNSIRPFTGGGF